MKLFINPINLIFWQVIFSKLFRSIIRSERLSRTQIKCRHCCGNLKFSSSPFSRSRSTSVGKAHPHNISYHHLHWQAIYLSRDRLLAVLFQIKNCNFWMFVFRLIYKSFNSFKICRWRSNPFLIVWINFFFNKSTFHNNLQQSSDEVKVKVSLSNHLHCPRHLKFSASSGRPEVDQLPASWPHNTVVSRDTCERRACWLMRFPLVLFFVILIKRLPKVGQHKQRLMTKTV